MPSERFLTLQRLLTVKIGAPIGMGPGGKVKEILSWVPISEADAIEVRRVAVRPAITLHVGG